MSQATIGNLNVRLGMDTAEFSSGVKRAKSSLGALSASVKGFAAGLVGALSLAGVTSALQASVSHMDDLGKAAQKIGIPVEELSKLEYAARLSDIGLDALTTTVARFSRNLAEIRSGGQNDAGAALRALGVSATDAQGQLRPTTEIMSDIAEKFAVMQDGAGKTALAMALFGKSGADMIPLLNGGRAAIAGAGEELQRFGGVITEQAAVAAEAFNDNLTRLQAAGAGLSTEIASALLPSMVELTNAMVDFSAQGQIAEQIAAALEFIMKEMAVFVSNASAAWEELTGYVVFAGEAFDALTNMDPAAIGAAWAKAADTSTAAWARNAETVARIRGEVQSVNSAMKVDLPSAQRTIPAPIMPGTSNSLKRTSSGVPEIAPMSAITIEDIRGSATAIDDLAASMGEATKAGEGLNSVTSQLASTFSSWIGDAIDGTFDLKSALADLAKSAGSSLLSSGLQGLFGGATGGGLFGSLFSGFAGLFAGGGSIPSGKWGIAGEAGPEIISGPSTVTPMSKVGGGQVHVMISLSDDLRSEVDQKVAQGVRVSVSESQRATERNFTGMQRQARVRKG